MEIKIEKAEHYLDTVDVNKDTNETMADITKRELAPGFAVTIEYASGMTSILAIFKYEEDAQAFYKFCHTDSFDTV